MARLRKCTYVPLSYIIKEDCSAPQTYQLIGDGITQWGGASSRRTVLSVIRNEDYLIAAKILLQMVVN